DAYIPKIKRARHILFRADPKDDKAMAAAEKKARAALARVKAGADFTALVEELSEDPAGRQDGGDLDRFSRRQQGNEFSGNPFQKEAAAVRSQFGWHVMDKWDYEIDEKQRTVTLTEEGMAKMEQMLRND